jgi:hypothetical protein
MKTGWNTPIRGAGRRSFTMVELMIVSGLFVTIMAGTLAVYVMCQKSWYSTSLQMQATRGASMGVARMVYGLGTNGGLREAAGLKGLNLLTNMNGIWTGGVYPPAATSSSHYVTQAVTLANPSWRLVCSNYAGGITWYDYNRAASNIVFWPRPGQPGRRELVANYVTGASVIFTNQGVVLSLTVARRHGNYSTSVTNTTFLRPRN